jgi:hypothetical protein
MGVRVLLGALALGLILFGSGGAHAGRDIGPVVGPVVANAAAVLLTDVHDATAYSQDDERKPSQRADQTSSNGDQPDTEEVCTVLMVLRGQGLAAPPASAGRHTNGPHTSGRPLVPPPKPWAPIFKTAKSISAGHGASETEPRTDLIRELDSCGSLPNKTASFWDLDDSKGSPLASGEGGHPDSEVCTVLMVWRGAKPACAKAARLPTQAPFQSIVPPVPPPQRGTTTTAYLVFARAPETGSAVAGDAGPLGPLATPQPADCDSLPQKTTSAWDLDDDPGPLSLDSSERGEPDSEVCTVLMVWRGVKRPIDEDKRLRPQAPALSTGPPVPPPQRSATTADFAFACASEAGRAAVRETRLLDTRSAKHATITSLSSLGPLRQDLTSWGRRAVRPHTAARETVSNLNEITNTKSSLSKGSTLWGTL